MFSGTNQQNQMDGVRNLREFVQSAATVLSSASTILSGDQDDVRPEDGDDFRSDFGDWFRSDTNESTLDWIYSTTGKTFLHGVGETKTSQEPLPTSSNPSEGKLLASPPALPPAIELIEEASSHNGALTLPIIHEPQQSVNISAPQTKDDSQYKENAIHLEQPVSSVDLSLIKPPLPSHQRSQRSESALKHVSLFKEKRRSLVHIFSRNGSVVAKPTLKEKPGPAQREGNSLWQRSAAPIRKKFVLVGDGACGKTCFLAYVFLHCINSSN